MADGKDERMIYKWLGALLVIGACGSFGFKLVATHKYEERTLRQLLATLDYMTCELRYRLTPLPVLCRQAAHEAKGVIADLLEILAGELEDQVSPDVNCCMLSAIEKTKGLPEYVIQNLILLGKSLGKFDLEGQLLGLEGVRHSCRCVLDELTRNRDNRLRSYQTLALCAGAAIAILFV